MMLLLLGQILLIAAVLFLPFWTLLTLVIEKYAHGVTAFFSVLLLGGAIWLPFFYGWW